MSANNPYSLMLHGGAGRLDQVRDGSTAVRYLDSLRGILEHGRDILSLGGSALQAVEACTVLLEDDPLFNAGCGSVLNADGNAEMDAAIMDGRDLGAGAVAALRNIANPVQLARRVLSESEHVLLVADGAQRFAAEHGFEPVADAYFRRRERVAQLERVRRDGRVALDHGSAGDVTDGAHGTVGAVALDLDGNLAAATSTGGMVNKRAGRVGDSPLLGAGVYADNDSCAVSATGNGEDLMRTVIAKTIADHIALQDLDAAAATAAAIDLLRRRVHGQGGVIVIDRHGRCASGMTTAKMIHGWIELGGDAVVRF